ncbi:class I SAM-dependent methyltransferase [Pseudonocardia spinosispora]|uniref:class I SAM-dependent methyltransferase n=1 Tax=Pseudonocardia spinosispora TaxID=103441 RepID=UPI0003FEF5CB|nr:class I SAM-dependent methyltransferase [Pseudonocardia spinosispora]
MSGDWKGIVRRGYDAVSERYRADHDAPAEYEAWLHLLAERLPINAEIRDLGCGCGIPMARRLAELAHRIVGVDLSAVQIDRARRLVPRARFIRADAIDLVYSAASFDAIVCLYLLIHLPEREQEVLIQRAAAWLRTGGVFLATVGATAWTGEQSDWLGGGARMW